MPRNNREEWKVYKNVFDEFTLKTLFKLSCKGLFDELKSPIALGKEANVFTASKKDGEKVCAKIYRLESCDFNRMYEYIVTDPRLAKIKKQRRQVIFEWTRREYRNLMKMREIGVKCPTPYGFFNNVLIMELIGEPAPQIRDCPPEDPEKMFNKVVQEMKKMYKNEFVHGDLSQYNILNNNEDPVFIDFSQATNSQNSRYKEFWTRDIKNVSNYFAKLGVDVDEDKLKKMIKEVG